MHKTAREDADIGTELHTNSRFQRKNVHEFGEHCKFYLRSYKQKNGELGMTPCAPMRISVAKCSPEETETSSRLHAINPHEPLGLPIRHKQGVWCLCDLINSHAKHTN
jgi:hypothetical protein